MRKTGSGRRRGGRTRKDRAREVRNFLVSSALLVALALGLVLALSLPKRGDGATEAPSTPLPPGAGSGSQEAVPLAPAASTPPEAPPLPLAAETPPLPTAASRALTTTLPDRLAAEPTYAPNPADLRDTAALLARKDRGVRDSAVYARPDRGRRAGKKRLIFVIDDVGYGLAQLKPFLALPFPLTFAVLPGLPHSAEAAALVRGAGKELILHQPMEALGGVDPGPGAILLGTSPEEAAAILEANLDTLPGALGFNNHEGSAVTRDRRLMASILGVAKKRGIYYLDSLTIPDTATSWVASREKIRYWERDVFLDNSPDRVSIIRYIDLGKKKAEKSGSAVMIGHVWSAQLAATLSELYPQLVEEGFSLSTISKVMMEEVDAGSGD